MAYSNWASAYPYLELMQSTSQCWALYCLVLFYQATKKKLGPIHPLNKFICIKMVVFFTFWQEVVIASLVRFKIIRSNQFEDMDDAYGAGGSNSATMHWSTTEIANGINDFIVCVEMLGFAIAHIYVFPPSDYIRAERMSVHVSVRDETSFNAVNLHDPYGKLNDLEDPETHVTEQRVHGGFQNHRMLEQLIQGVNFFDLINDVKTLHELDAHHRENEHLNGSGYKTFGS
uniref:Transmembrane protein 184C n=1 Tax=Octactis speculum TaxID=3111310 RepID=A0A7S2F4T4_9STRA